MQKRQIDNMKKVKYNNKQTSQKTTKQKKERKKQKREKKKKENKHKQPTKFICRKTKSDYTRCKNMTSHSSQYCYAHR